MLAIDKEAFTNECAFKTSRSGGKGGQHVNKVETKVELLFDVSGLKFFSDEQKELLLQKLVTRIIDGAILQLTSSTERSLLKNKEIAVSKAIELIQKALKPKKPRKATQPTFESIEKRLSDKQMKSMKKRIRKRLF
ncbi:MAG: aminoacyl-tRNA hydrolase [Prevotellaceae bacterium]|jgi:ribosome-associated protein|nr:aminoacyl-tRNA hydrolase [Prevotellaceae bacterium]